MQAWQFFFREWCNKKCMFLSNPAIAGKTFYHKGDKEVCDIKLSNCHNIYAANQLIRKRFSSIARLAETEGLREIM